MTIYLVFMIGSSTIVDKRVKYVMEAPTIAG